MQATHVRTDDYSGDEPTKKFRWERNGANNLQGLPVADLSLYLSHLLPGIPEEYEPCFLVEGEKAADALTTHGFFGVATVCGAAAVPSDAVLSSLAGRHIILWADYDEPGLLHMKRVGKALYRLGVRVSIVEVEKLPGLSMEGEDAADVPLGDNYMPHVLAAVVPYQPEVHGLVATAARVAASFPLTTWLWERWLPRGYITLLTGTPGVGKSGVALSLAKTYLEDGCWPDGQPVHNGVPDRRRVLWLETEDSHGILRDRCLAWGVPMDRILLWGAEGLDRPELDKPETAAALSEVIMENNVGFVILDTLAGAHYQEENSANIKRTMQVLTRLAQTHDIAVVAVHHLRKKQQNEAEGVTLDRVRGSSAIAASARAVLAVWANSNDKGEVFLAVIKSNLCVPPAMVASRMGTEGGPSYRVIDEEAEAPSVETVARGHDDVALIHSLLPADGGWIANAELLAAFQEAASCGPARYVRARTNAKLHRDTRGTALWFKANDEAQLEA